MAVKKHRKSKVVLAFVDKLCDTFPKKKFYSVGNEKSGNVSVMLEGTLTQHKKFIKELVDKMRIKRYTIKEERLFDKDLRLSEVFISIDVSL